MDVFKGTIDDGSKAVQGAIDSAQKYVTLDLQQLEAFLTAHKITFSGTIQVEPK